MLVRMTIEQLSERVSSLERSGRRWRAGCVLLALAGVAAWGVGATPGYSDFQAVRTHSLDILDDSGRTCANIYADKGGTHFEMKNPDEPTVRAYVGIFGTGVLLNVGSSPAGDRSPMSRASFAVKSEDGHPAKVILTERAPDGTDKSTRTLP